MISTGLCRLNANATGKNKGDAARFWSIKRAASPLFSRRDQVWIHLVREVRCPVGSIVPDSILRYIAMRWRLFKIWLTILLLFFVIANIAGAVKPRGLSPFRFTGFPYTFAAWGTGVEQFFDTGLLLLNCIIAIFVSSSLATAIGWVRYKISRNEDKSGRSGIVA